MGNPDDDSGTASVSRDFAIHISDSGLLSIGGGKWTTYRHMAEEAVNKAAEFAELSASPCVTKTLNIHGYHENAERFGDLWWYGTDAVEIESLIRSDASLKQPLDPELSLNSAQVIWAVRSEMARTVEDVLARRTRSLLLHARASIRCAPKVAALMAGVLHRDQSWQDSQIHAFTELARGYLPQ
jgi:glycerol-3-phosphate dehydrogenase